MASITLVNCLSKASRRGGRGKRKGGLTKRNMRDRRRQQQVFLCVPRLCTRWVGGFPDLLNSLAKVAARSSRDHAERQAEGQPLCRQRMTNESNVRRSRVSLKQLSPVGASRRLRLQLKLLPTPSPLPPPASNLQPPSSGAGTSKLPQQQLQQNGKCRPQNFCHTTWGSCWRNC